jgi:homoserine kinase
VLSGAGPSLLAVARNDGEGQAVAAALEKAMTAAGVAGVARALTVDARGATASVDAAP